MPNPLRHHEPHHTRLFLFFTISRNLLKFMSVESVMLPNHLILCCPPSPAALNLFSIRAFSSESALHIRWPKYWSLSFSISLSNKCSGLISFRIDWFDLLAVQRTLKSLLQHYNWKASTLWPSVFFMVQLLNLYMTTGKTILLQIPSFQDFMEASLHRHDWHKHQGLNSISGKSPLLKGLSQSHLINITKDTFISLIT